MSSQTILPRATRAWRWHRQQYWTCSGYVVVPGIDDHDTPRICVGRCSYEVVVANCFSIFPSIQAVNKCFPLLSSVTRSFHFARVPDTFHDDCSSLLFKPSDGVSIASQRVHTIIMITSSLVHTIILLLSFAFTISNFVSAASWISASCAWCSSEMPPSKQVNGHSFTICLMVWSPPQSQSGEAM